MAPEPDGGASRVAGWPTRGGIVKRRNARYSSFAGEALTVRRAVPHSTHVFCYTMLVWSSK